MKTYVLRERERTKYIHTPRERKREKKSQETEKVRKEKC